MRLAAAELIQGPSTPRGQSASGATLEKVTAWLDEQREDIASGITAAEAAAAPLPAGSRHDALWHTLTLIGAPLLWPATMEALWLGEPVWQHLQKRGQWFQVVEAMLWDGANDQVLAKAERAWRRVATTESALETLLRVPTTGDNEGETSANAAPDEHVIVLVGMQSRLAVRVFGYPPPELRDALQDIYFEADEVLEESVAEAQDR